MLSFAHLESENGIDGEIGKVIFVLSQNLGTQSRPGDVQEVLAKLHGVRAEPVSRLIS